MDRDLYEQYEIEDNVKAMKLPRINPKMPSGEDLGKTPHHFYSKEIERITGEFWLQWYHRIKPFGLGYVKRTIDDIKSQDLDVKSKARILMYHFKRGN